MLGADPFLAALQRHRLAAGLIVLQAALTTIVLVLALGKASAIAERIARPSGLDEARMLRVVLAGPLAAGAQADEQQALSRLPGVVTAMRINQLPFGADSWQTSIGIGPGMAGGTLRSAVYLGETDLRPRLGLALLQGRDFAAQEQARGFDDVRYVQLGESTAARLFRDGKAVGQTVFMGKQPLRVVGVYAALQGATPESRDSMILPVPWPDADARTYVLRLHEAPGPAPQMIAAAVRAVSPQRWLVDARSVQDLRGDYFRQQRWLGVGLLLGLGLWLTATTVGLASLADLLLQARQRQVGVCRALGARSAQIRWQLRRENLLLSAGGA
ncbi:MAG TPA: ABC transporter permease, partial [Stenotrophomonas sp.]|nr:ABC transporter permease [Stenotrophomonas sp.]